MLGCGDVTVDEERTRVTRSGDVLYVECLDTQVVHKVVCRQREWVGQINCSALADTGHQL